MSDYFGALLRSAGAPTPAAGPAKPAAGAAAADDGEADLFEQKLEVPASPLFGPAPAASPPLPADSVPVTPDAGAPTTTAPHHVAPHLPHSTSPAALRPREDVHPAVRAALQWVAADPAVLSPKLAVPFDKSAADAEFAVMQRSARAPSSTAWQQPPRLTPNEAASQPERTPPAPAGPQPGLVVTPTPAAPPRAPMVGSTTRSTSSLREPRWAAEPRPAATRPMEVNIGTIHVTVDAMPASRAVAQAVQVAPAAPRPIASTVPAAMPTPRSGFSRARVPRL